jgi:hypothetical protein
VCHLRGILAEAKDVVSKGLDEGDAKYHQVQWWFLTDDEVRKKIAPVTEGEFTPRQRLSIAILLKDAGIKYHAFLWLIRIMTAFATIVIVVGLALPLLDKLLDLRLSAGNMGSYQSVFVVGFGGLMLSIRRQYIEKRNRLQRAVRPVFANCENFEAKQARILAAFTEIDALLLHD